MCWGGGSKGRVCGGGRGASAVTATTLSPLPWFVVVLSVCFLIPQLSPVRGVICPADCLCAADILSCTAMGAARDKQVPKGMPAVAVVLDLSHNHIVQLEQGSFEGLVRLEKLRLAHNQIALIQPGAFRNSSGPLLRHLDLSSNRLRALEVHHFLELTGLEELLLFNNRLGRVESRALAGMGRLRKAYLSHNRLTDFPFFSIQDHSHPQLSMLDLSSNRLPKLPIEDISNLPLAVQRGLYLHNNSLVCECSMYGLFRHWEQREYASVLEFRHEHTCLVYGIQRGTVRFFQHPRYFENCSMAAKNLLRLQAQQESDVHVFAGERTALNCVTALRGRHVQFIWVTPNQEYVAPPGNNGSLKMYDNGTLVIAVARAEDAGIYWCMARDKLRQHNETCEVNVTVALQRDGDNQDNFNTGFTTLLGCVVSLVLVLMYLYLTPCRCPPWRKAPSPTTATTSPGNEAGGAGSGQSSILNPTLPGTTEEPGRKVSTNKHVVFLEPIKEQQNGRLRLGPGTGAGHGHLGPGLLLGAEHAAKLHNQSQQRAGQTVMSVFSDTPIMLP